MILVRTSSMRSPRTSCPIIWKSIRPDVSIRQTSQKTRNFQTSTFRSYNDNYLRQTLLRQRLIREISSNPNFLTSANPSIKPRQTSWLRKSVIFASFCCATFTISLGYQFYLVYASEDPKAASSPIFIPLWLGFNWPRQRRMPFPSYLQYIDSKDSPRDPNNEKYHEAIRRQDVEHQVLDCLFRSPVVRETFKLPISVYATPKDTFEVWIEPQHCTLHGPVLQFGRDSGGFFTKYDWKIKSIHWTSDVDDFVSGLTSEFESLSATEARRNTQNAGSGRVHRADESEDPKPGPVRTKPTKKQAYLIAFRGIMEVSDFSDQHRGTVAYTGIIDEGHSGLSGGVKITTMTLDVAEYGRSSILYKLK